MDLEFLVTFALVVGRVQGTDVDFPRRLGNHVFPLLQRWAPSDFSTLDILEFPPESVRFVLVRFVEWMDFEKGRQ